jgi:hypothetical protein
MNNPLKFRGQGAHVVARWIAFMGGRYEVWLENLIIPEMTACSSFTIRPQARINPQQNSSLKEAQL